MVLQDWHDSFADLKKKILFLLFDSKSDKTVNNYILLPCKVFVYNYNILNIINIIISIININKIIIVINILDINNWIYHNVFYSPSTSKW